MKRKIKFAAGITAAGALTLGSAMLSFADWNPLGNGDWSFTDSSGSRVTNEWRQSGNHYFYLNSDGIMARNQWVDDTYYVNADGARLSNTWIYTPEGEDAPNSDGGWFYLGENGRAVTDGWRTINGQRYHFDDEGAMSYGWFHDEDDLYYLGDENDGAMKTGWLALAWDEDEIPDDGEVSSIVSSGEMGAWFYFQSNGQAVRAEDDTYVSRRINGYRYYFDENGVMADGWAEVGEREDGDITGISTLKYFGTADQGQMAVGWRYIYDEPTDSNDDFSYSTASSSNASSSALPERDNWGDGAWYYFDSNGVPAYLSSEAHSLSEAVTRINGQSYFFDEYGRMQSGMLGFRMEGGTILSAYFGADDSDGAMKRDRQTNVYDEEGERGTYYFNTSGVNRGGGYTGERNGYLYANGKLVQAEDGEDFQVFEVEGRLYLVDESGRVQDRNRTYRVDGEYRYEYDNGTIYYINEDRERLGEVSRGEGELPEISYREVYDL